MRIPIHVSPERPEPMYHQIAEQLRALILSGELTEGEPLPSIRELAVQLSCSVITIRRVYQDLENEGFLRTRQGTGTFVARVESALREKLLNDAVYEALRAAVEVAVRVQCPPERLRAMLERAISEHANGMREGRDHR